MDKKTVRQLAEELHVSKTAIRKYMPAEFRCKHVETDSTGTIWIDAEGCKLIAETLQTNRKPIAETTENQVFADSLTVPREVWEALQGQITAQAQTIEAQRKQIDDYSARLAETTSALAAAQETARAAQALHAGTIQKQLQEGSDETAVTVQESRKGIFARIFKK